VVALPGGGGGVATLDGTVTFDPQVNNLPTATPAGGAAFLRYANRVGDFAQRNSTTPSWTVNNVTYHFLTPSPNANGTEYDMFIGPVQPPPPPGP